NIDTQNYQEKSLRVIDEQTSDEQVVDILTKNALENIDEANPDWTYVARRIYMKGLYNQAAKHRNYDAEHKYGDFYQLIIDLTDKGIYSQLLLEKYSKVEIQNFATAIDAKRDELFDYLGLHTFATRYLATDHNKNLFELPQERWMIIATYLMQDETVENRSERVLEAYWSLSTLFMTVATPTMNNSGNAHQHLSSGFRDTVDASLQPIYDGNSDDHQFPKNHRGSRLHMEKVRQRGSPIKG